MNVFGLVFFENAESFRKLFSFFFLFSFYKILYNILKKKKMDIVLSEVIYYALFKHKIILDTKKILLYLPTDAFGVFVTIRRPPPPPPPQATAADIHGCIGYWKESFEALSPTKLYDHLLRVANAAVWTDHRRSYFKVPLAQDSLRTFVEVDFMLHPPYLIDTDTGLIPALANEPFRNEKYGLLLQSPHGRARATYLPKVFLNTPWPTILASLKHKAGLNGGGGGDDFHVYAYRIQQVTAPLVHLLTHKTFAYANLCNFARFMLQYQKPNALLVYARTKEGVLQWNSRDKVRNLATTSDVLKYAELFPLLKAQYHSQLADLRHHITHILAKTEAYSAQALSFLASHVTTTPVQQQAQYCRKLYAEVAAGNAVFAQPEIIIGLQKAQCAAAPVATAPLPILTFGPDDSIFKMNWVMQALTPPIPPKLILILIHKVMTMTMTITTTETNYLAVAFEALCFAFTQKKQKEETQQQMLSLMFELIFELEQRKHACCLYGFLDHSARVDITTHVNNGLYRRVPILRRTLVRHINGTSTLAQVQLI